jgi:carbamoyl-phosphate synthase large subunit
MRSTGEGMCLAPTLKEALGKVFDEDRDKSSISVFMDAADYTLIQKAEAAGLKTETECFLKWAETVENGVFLSLKNEESKEKRLLAAEKGIKVFSDSASFMAYLKAASDYKVYSIRELTRTGVNMI